MTETINTERNSGSMMEPMKKKDLEMEGDNFLSMPRNTSQSHGLDVVADNFDVEQIAEAPDNEIIQKNYR